MLLVSEPIRMNSPKLFHNKKAISKGFTIILSVLLVLSIVIGIVIFRYSTTPAPAANNPPPITMQYAEFERIQGLGNGTWQFEVNNQHVYNYTWNQAVAAFNSTVNGSIIVPPTLHDGVLLVDLSGSSNTSGTVQYYGGVAAINMRNGKIMWETTVPNMMMTQPLTYEDLVIIGLGNNEFQESFLSPLVRGTGTNYVAALNFSTGKTVWTYPTAGEDMPTPVICNGSVVGVNGNGVVYSLNALTGQEDWHLSLPPGTVVSMSSPALLGDAIYFGARGPYSFYCVNLTEHKVAWSTNTPAYRGLDDCSPAIWSDMVFSGYTTLNTAGLVVPVLFAMNISNGNVLWQIEQKAGIIPSDIEVPPVTVWNGIVYSDPTESGTLFAVNSSNGNVLWTYPTGADTSNVNVFDGNLWMVNSNGTLFVLNPDTGTVLKTANVEGSLGPGNLIFAGQNVIICTLNGKVTCMPAYDIYPGAK